jgi:hypothetical protein
VRVSDAGAAITPLGACRADGPGAICPTPNGYFTATVDLGDSEDELDWWLGVVDVHAGAGDDRIRASGSVDGGPGADTMDSFGVRYDTRTASVRVTPDGIANDGEPGEADDVRPGVNRIEGGRGADLISAAGYGVTVVGGDGDDRLTGGPLRDWLHGGSGDDVIDGGDAADFIQGGAGGDEIHGGGDQDGDTVIGGAGGDRVAVGGYAQLEMSDGERDELACGLPGALRIDADTFDVVSGCTFAYLRFSPAARVYTSRDQRVRVRATCFSSPGRNCDGAVRLRPAKGRAVLASGPFHLVRDETGVVELKLRAAGRSLQRRQGRASVEAVAVHQVRSGPPPGADLDTWRTTWVTRPSR